MNLSYKQLVQLVLGYLAIRNRSEQEIRFYLGKKTTDDQLIDQVITYLTDHSLINDQTFGQQWAEARVRSLKGDIQITQELLHKGLSRESIRQILDQVDPDSWLMAMDTLVAKKSAKYAQLNTYQQKGKIYQLLAQHGYSSKLIDAFLRRKVE